MGLSRIKQVMHTHNILIPSDTQYANKVPKNEAPRVQSHSRESENAALETTSSFF